MSRTVEVQRFDNNINLYFNIKNNGVIEPILGAKVYLKFINKADPTDTMKRVCEITDAELAECKYVLVSKDISVIGTYDTEVETHYPNGTILSTLTSPMTLVVKPEIVDDKDENFNPRFAQQPQQPQKPKEQPVIQFL